ncbi:MAG: M28 family metallopeptidase [Bryobacteraceae bacterium]|nr:M28 family metallopeptidase [Bryobacteraceae bacterium]
MTKPFVWPFLIATLSAADLSPAAARWWKHVEVLADDKMEGRETGSKGHRMAAEYVAAEFERAGLKPSGSKGYFQPVGFRVRRIDEERSSLELVRDGQAEPVALGREATIGLRIDPAPSIEAGMVFAGYGFRVPEKDFDDLAGLDLKGKIVVYIQGVPEGIPSELSAHYQHASVRSKTLRDLGAIGTIVIQNPKNADIPWARASRARLLPAMDLADPSLDEGGGMKISLAWNAERADRLLAGSGHTMAELLALADKKSRLPRFELVGTLRARQTVRREEVESQNVIGIVPGSDPKLKSEWVVFSAHLDHVGKSVVIEGDGIHNGAMDNASGIASLIEIAKMFRERGVKPKRSLAFVAVTGEEKGLKGSHFFATHPTIPGRMVANLNMDMYLPIHSLEVIRVLGLSDSDLGDTFAAVAKEAGVRVQPDPQPERNAFIRSDQYNFVRQGVPSINAGFGFDKGSPEEKQHKDWLTERYHAPSDDLSQPVDKEAAAKFNGILFEFARRVADQTETPRWKDTSFFRRFARN